MEKEARNYIRHPSEIPIEVSFAQTHSKEKMTNLSFGGLCFLNREPIAEGEAIHITIPLVKPPFAIDAMVRWCKQKQDLFLIGVALLTEDEAYCLRLVEQVCYIERYRQKLLKEKGLRLSSEQAAKQWIENNAGQFKQDFY